MVGVVVMVVVMVRRGRATDRLHAAAMAVWQLAVRSAKDWMTLGAARVAHLATPATLPCRRSHSGRGVHPKKRKKVLTHVTASTWP